MAGNLAGRRALVDDGRGLRGVQGIFEDTERDFCEAETLARPRPVAAFTPEGLLPDSQAYAVRAIRAAFAWLTMVRYLAGNPWSAVSDPATVMKEVSAQVERALSTDLWAKVRHALDQRCGNQLFNETQEQVRQWRTARAAILLMGESGLRRE